MLYAHLGFGDFGIPELNYVRGTRTPRINQLADEGLSLMRMYTEPSCTPTRAAMLTGRHPVRIGIKEVKVALVGEGLPAEEVTIAEVLSQAGYNTSHVGKWHQGDIEEAYPHNQGFDYAAFPLHQQVQLSLMTKDAAHANNMFGWHRSTQSGEFAIDHDFKPRGLVTGVEALPGVGHKTASVVVAQAFGRPAFPVDTHIHRIGRNLGLTNRRTASWATAEEITAALRQLDPSDPVKYDFALCHLGVSRDCPSRADPAKCAGCVLRRVCVAWGAAPQRVSPKKAS